MVRAPLRPLWIRHLGPHLRALQAYLLALPVVNQAANRSAILTMGPANKTVPIWERMVDAHTVELT